MKKTNNISWCLFGFKPSFRCRNLRDIPIFIERIFFTLKHGYAPQASWETFCWFIDTMKEILTRYRHDSFGIPTVDINFTDEENEKAWHDILDRMIELLDLMDEDNPLYEDWDWKEEYAAKNNAKDEFFELFSKYFYNLWD